MLSGSVTINAAPPSVRLRALTCPPCWTMIFCTTARPRPVPLALVVKNGRNNLSRTSAEMPAPLSKIGDALKPGVVGANGFAADQYAAAVGGALQASAALRARFRNAWRNSPSSPGTLPSGPSYRMRIFGIASPISSTTRSINGLQRHGLRGNFQRPRVLEKFRHDVGDAAGLLQNIFARNRGLRLPAFRRESVARNRIW